LINPEYVPATGAGIIDALAMPETDNAKAALKTKVLNMLISPKQCTSSARKRRTIDPARMNHH